MNDKLLLLLSGRQALPEKTARASILRGISPQGIPLTQYHDPPRNTHEPKPTAFPREQALHSQHICFEKYIRGPPPSLIAANCSNRAGKSKKEMRADCVALLVQSRNYRIFQFGRKPQGVFSPTPNLGTFSQSKMKTPQL